MHVRVLYSKGTRGPVIEANLDAEERRRVDAVLKAHFDAGMIDDYAVEDIPNLANEREVLKRISEFVKSANP